MPILQQRLPLHLLPTTLYVHAPFRLLQVRYDQGEEYYAPSWFSQPDIVHTYSHTTSPAGREKMGKEKEKPILDRKTEEALRKGPKPGEDPSALPPYGFYIPSDAGSVPGPTEPWVYAMHEPPSLPSTPKEAHLYLSPSHMAGLSHEVGHPT